MEEGNNRLNSGSFSAEGGERKDRIGWLWSNFFSSAGILVVVVGRCLFGRSRGVVERSRVEGWMRRDAKMLPSTRRTWVVLRLRLRFFRGAGGGEKCW